MSLGGLHAALSLGQGCGRPLADAASLAAAQFDGAASPAARRPLFSEEEKWYMLSLVAGYKERNGRDARIDWRTIAGLINARFSNRRRCAAEVKKKWVNMRYSARIDYRNREAVGDLHQLPELNRRIVELVDSGFASNDSYETQDEALVAKADSGSPKHNEDDEEGGRADVAIKHELADERAEPEAIVAAAAAAEPAGWSGVRLSPPRAPPLPPPATADGDVLSLRRFLNAPSPPRGCATLCDGGYAQLLRVLATRPGDTPPPGYTVADVSAAHGRFGLVEGAHGSGAGPGTAPKTCVVSRASGRPLMSQWGLRRLAIDVHARDGHADAAHTAAAAARLVANWVKADVVEEALAQCAHCCMGRLAAIARGNGAGAAANKRKAMDSSARAVMSFAHRRADSAAAENRRVLRVHRRAAALRHRKLELEVRLLELRCARESLELEAARRRCDKEPADDDGTEPLL